MENNLNLGLEKENVLDKQLEKEIEKALKVINVDDIRAMFNTVITSSILKDLDKAQKEIEEYLKYDVPVCLGDIIMFQNSKYCVTCIYTDNTVDILGFGDNPSKRNIGLYRKEIEIIDKLQVIKEV